MPTNRRTALRLFTALPFVAFAAIGMAKDVTFTTTDLDKMVKELSLYIPENPNLQYPIVCAVEKDSSINAYASLGKPEKEGGKYIPKMTVLTGILDSLDKACKANMVVGLDPADPTRTIKLKDGDQIRLLRAVVAHEMAHLSRGHNLIGGYKPGDLNLIWTREIEYEADSVGTSALQRAGYKRQDAQDMLMFLDSSSADWPKTARLLGDHADCKRRALAVASDPRVLKSLVSFDMGLTFAEIRSWRNATAAFDMAAKQEPRLKETYINAAASAGQYYYDMLSPDVKEQWFRPDFGPLLSPFARSKGSGITEADQRRYADAEKHATVALEKAPDDIKTLEVVGLIQVLNPTGDATKFTAGIANLNKALAQAMDPRDRLRIANNLAIGYQRTGDVVKGVSTMMAAQRGNESYNAAVAQNLGLQPFPTALKSDAPLAADVMYTYLTNSPSIADGYERVQKQYAAVCKDYGLKAAEIKVAPIYLNATLTLNEGGQEISLFDPIASVDAKLGAGEVTMGFLPSGEDRIKPGEAVGVFEKRYKGGQVLTLWQSVAGETELMRITSYNPGASVEITPSDEGVSGVYRFTVGMAEADAKKILNLDKAPKKSFIRVGKLEEWTYFPNLKFGVAITDGKVSGLTVTPADRE